MFAFRILVISEISCPRWWNFPFQVFGNFGNCCRRNLRWKLEISLFENLHIPQNSSKNKHLSVLARKGEKAKLQWASPGRENGKSEGRFHLLLLFICLSGVGATKMLSFVVLSYCLLIRDESQQMKQNLSSNWRCVSSTMLFDFYFLLTNSM